MTGKSGYVSAGEAAALLGVRPATLYAYVSRGLIRSEATGGRARRYRAEDIAALKRRQTRDPAAAAEAALNFGAPVLDSAITLILDGRLYYRGQDASVLARDASIEAVAALLWQADAAAIFAAENVPKPGPAYAALAPGAAALSAVERCLVLLPAVAAGDARALDLSPRAVARTGARLLRQMAAIVAGKAPSSRPIDAVLAGAWKLDEASRRLVSAALVLCADHELNVSAFTARCVASARAHPYNAVIAGIAALEGARHGGESERADAFLGEALAAKDPAGLVAQRLKRGERIPGFGHPLYPEGDPRARMLLDLLEQRKRPRLAEARRVADAVAELTGRLPNVDFALGLLRRALGLPEGSALALFMLGRAAGWIAHAIEQYAAPQLIRPRARYVGAPPNAMMPWPNPQIG